MKYYLSMAVIAVSLFTTGCCGSGNMGCCGDCVVETTTSGCCGSSTW